MKKQWFAMLTVAAMAGSMLLPANGAEAGEGAITSISGLTDLLIGYDVMVDETRGEKATLIAYTDDAAASGVTWSSSDESVVTVDEQGVIWAKGVGEAEITAENSQGSFTQTVTVKENMTLEEVVDQYFISLLDLGDTAEMSAEELVEMGNSYFYIPHSIEGSDEEIIEAAENRTFTEQVAFYSKAEAYYNAALEKEDGNEEAQAKLEELYAYRDLVKRLDEDGQGIAYSWFSSRNELSEEQRNAFAYDDVFFFAEPQYRGMDTLIGMVGDTDTVEGIELKIAVYRFNAIYLGKGGAYTEISRFYIDKDTYPDYPLSMDIGIDYLRWSFDAEVVATTDFKGPRYLGDYCTSGWTNDIGEEVAPDYEKAVECYNIALSNKGAFDLTACLKMAFWYYDGEIVEKDDTLAFTYLVYGYYNGSNLHATQTNMPEGLFVLAQLFENGIEGAVDADAELANTFYTYSYKSAEAMIGRNDEVEDEDMEAVMADVTEALEAAGMELNGEIVIGESTDDFDEAFETLLKPYIGMIETYLGVKGVK
ncbi:MAG: Ig-like domain-containing protein [Eubacteriales bacterium]|nr:Ig-like domain-containing protein [Eubacteriales bacterium]